MNEAKHLILPTPLPPAAPILLKFSPVLFDDSQSAVGGLALTFVVEVAVEAVSAAGSGAERFSELYDSFQEDGSL
jgi:hypothetical protein